VDAGGYSHDNIPTPGQYCSLSIPLPHHTFHAFTLRLGRAPLDRTLWNKSSVVAGVKIHACQGTKVHDALLGIALAATAEVSLAPTDRERL